MDARAISEKFIPETKFNIKEAKNVVGEYHANDFLEAIHILNELGLLIDRTYSALIKLFNNFQYDDVRPILKILLLLKEKNILTEKSILILCELKNDSYKLKMIEPIFLILEQENMLSEDNYISLQEAINLYMRYELDDLHKCIIYLHEKKCIKDNFSMLCEQTMHTGNLLTILKKLDVYKELTESYVKIFIQHAKYSEDFLDGFYILLTEKIDRSNNIKSYCQHMNDNPRIYKFLKIGLKYLYDHNIATYVTFAILNQHPHFADTLAKIIHRLNQLSFFDILKSKIPDKKILGEILLLISFIDFENLKEITRFSTSDEIYHYIIKDNTNRFDEYVKIAAYFLINHKMIINEFTQDKIHHSLSELNPAPLREKIKNGLTRLGGYSFMPDDEKNITLGVEIEYSNIPVRYKSLTEYVMQNIQKKWSHPGDNSVDYIGINTYSGESTTPIIHHNTDLKATLLNVAFLQAMNAQTNKSCGLHVHIGIENIPTPPEYKRDDIPEMIIKRGKLKPITVYQFEFIKQFILIYKREEEKFACIERAINDSEGYSKIIKIPENLHDIEDLDSLTQIINPHGRKYELNLYAFNLHGTIEIRRFSGSTDESEIYATISMISAMAKEAQARTNHIFDVKLKQKIENGTVEEKTTPPARYQKTEEEKDSLPLSFVTQQKTERERELFLLRVKSIHETQIKMIQEEEKNQSFSNNTVYLHLTHDDKELGYLFYNEKGFKKTGTIYYSDEDQYDKRFNSIIDKIKQKQSASLTLEEKNQLLYEIAEQSGAHISHRIDKLKQIDCHARLFSTYIENHKNKVKENNSTHAADHSVKFHMSGS